MEGSERTGEESGIGEGIGMEWSLVLRKGLEWSGTGCRWRVGAGYSSSP